jgi:Zn-dependent protease with chaperone function
MHQSLRRVRAHAEAARITGRRLPAASGAVVLDAPQPAAYCVPGRPAAIVLTSGALALLDPAQLAAVIAHEKAHLAGTHHMLVMCTHGLAAAFPGVPLFTRGTAEVTRLTEMRADDLAARISGRPVLIAALLAMGTGAAIPPLTLGATAGLVAERVQRLLEPRPRSQHARNRLALMIVTALPAATFGLLIWFADPVIAHAIGLASGHATGTKL